jgi:hypothetical protein
LRLVACGFAVRLQPDPDPNSVPSCGKRNRVC